MFTWTNDGDKATDTIHRAACRHTRLARHRDPVNLNAETIEDAQREIALSMGWDNWPAAHPAEFDLHIAPCAR